jgi:DNA polymerase-3 subunit epsilon
MGGAVIMSFTVNLKHEDMENKRDRKGKSLADFVNEYVAVDLETTGLDPRYDDIIEVAAVHIKDGSVIAEFQSLINPGYEISKFITDLTGITNEMLQNAPKIQDVLPGFIEFLKDRVLVAHNANFDINFLYDNCMYHLGIPLKNDFIDTMRLCRLLYRGLPNYKLNTLLQHFGICEQVEHRSYSDALNAARCYEHMKKYASETGIDINDRAKKQSKYGSYFKVGDVTATETDFDESHPFYGKVIVFTGTLEKMLRREAAQIVVNVGGICADTVTAKTDYLVLGNLDYNKNIKGGKSSKLKKAEQLKLSGAGIEIISENVFYDMMAGK